MSKKNSNEFFSSPIEKREYLCKWEPPKYEKRTKLHPFSFFSEENGYEPELIEKIRGLGLTEAVLCDGPEDNPQHYVLRVK